MRSTVSRCVAILVCVIVSGRMYSLPDPVVGGAKRVLLADDKLAELGFVFRAKDITIKSPGDQYAIGFSRRIQFKLRFNLFGRQRRALSAVTSSKGYLVTTAGLRSYVSPIERWVKFSCDKNPVEKSIPTGLIWPNGRVPFLYDDKAPVCLDLKRWSLSNVLEIYKQTRVLGEILFIPSYPLKYHVSTQIASRCDSANFDGLLPLRYGCGHRYSLPIEILNSSPRLFCCRLSTNLHRIQSSLHDLPLLKGKESIEYISDRYNHRSYRNPMIGIIQKSRLIGWGGLGIGILISIFSVLCMALRFWNRHGGFGAGVCVGLCVLALGYWIVFQSMSILFVSVSTPAHSDYRPVVSVSSFSLPCDL